MPKPMIIVHGGAWNIPDDLVDAYLEGVENAVKAGWEILKSGGTAIDAVEAAIRVMEDDPTFDAGVGSFLNEEGFVELDAVIMDGKTVDAGAVAGVRNIKNPITLARKVLEETEHVLIVGEGANKFAKKLGIEEVRPEDLVLPREIERWKLFKKGKLYIEDIFEPKAKGTVGAVAIDKDGNIVAGTSTGGITGKMVGRVGDTPIVGSGAYADNEIGGISTTGHGEKIMRVVLAKTIINLLMQGISPQEAAEAGIDILWNKVKGRGGVIVLNRDGEIGFAYNTPRMAYAYIKDGKVVKGV